MSYKGFFKPRNPEKYRGDPANIVYRSRWELKFMGYLDSHPDVLEWASEEFSIPYRSPVDNRVHRYFPDFVLKKRETNGSIKVEVIEIKPFKQTQQPAPQTKQTKQYLREVYTWGINEAKWKAARSFCEDRKWTFRILTEHELGIKF